MLVYGDRAHRAQPRKALRALTAKLVAAEQTAAGPERHDRLTEAFLDASALAQGIADAEFAAAGEDDLTPTQDAAMALLLVLAKKLAASAWSDFMVAGPPVAAELMALAVSPLPEQVEAKTPEGYAFYAVYPEAYLKAAAEHPWSSPPFVIGLRSIGTGLAALVATAASAAEAATLRPFGDPFRRQLRLSPRLRAKLAAHAGPFAIVDEGPGLSGSSFAAAAALLADLGVEPERIVLLPSHRGGPGAEADPAWRAKWAAASKAVATFSDLMAETPLDAWFADLTGPVEAVESLSGGAWRAAVCAPGADWPPVNPTQERLKFRLRTASGAWLAKFAGLGAIGRGKLERARSLHRAGFTPEPLALRRGFLVEKWEVGRPGPQIDHGELIEHLGRYLGFRAREFPADEQAGASLEHLIEMARVNVGELLGGEASERLQKRLRRDLAEAGEPHPVHVDGRLHPWEWLTTPDGLLLKTDALDHSEAHDLVGCQDIAWDIAGAAVEFDLTPGQVEQLADAIAAAGAARPSPALIGVFAVCYPAFQAGWWRFAEQAAAPEERGRIVAHAARYAQRLAQLAAAEESAD